jgi:hypothetical protein
VLRLLQELVLSSAEAAEPAHIKTR